MKNQQYKEYSEAWTIVLQFYPQCKNVIVSTNIHLKKKVYSLFPEISMAGLFQCRSKKMVINIQTLNNAFSFKSFMILC